MKNTLLIIIIGICVIPVNMYNFNKNKTAIKDIEYESLDDRFINNKNNNISLLVLTEEENIYKILKNNKKLISNNDDILNEIKFLDNYERMINYE